MNKMDRALLELQLAQEDLYQNFQKTIESVNVIVATYTSDEVKEMGPLEVNPIEGTVGFGSGLHGWAFTLKQFADMLAKKMGGKDPKKLMSKLWGNWCFVKDEKKWKKNDSPSEECPRAFCQFILDPIYKVKKLRTLEIITWAFLKAWKNLGLRCFFGHAKWK